MKVQRCVAVVLGMIMMGAHVGRADVEGGIAGTTSAIANGFTTGPHPEGSHFHSTNLSDLPPGNPTIPLKDAAEVGGFFGDEEVRGVSQFLLQDTAATAVLSYDILDMFDLGLSPEVSGIDGLYGQGSYEGYIDVYAYPGDNQEKLSDFEIPPLSPDPLIRFEVTSDMVAGVTYSIDVTSLYNGLVEDLASDPENAATALGVRLQMAEPVDFDAGAITFGNFQLELSQVPEPNAAWLLAMGVLGVMGRSRRRR